MVLTQGGQHTRSLVDTNTDLKILTDLEPDDIGFFLTLFDELARMKPNSKGELPTVQIVVGEGNSPAQRVQMMRDMISAAKLDFPASSLDQISFEVLPGSSSGTDEPHQQDYTRTNFPLPTSSMPDPADTIDKVVNDIETAKDNGRNVTIVELKPVIDSAEILRRVGRKLDSNDHVIVSGSFNFRRAYHAVPRSEMAKLFSQNPDYAYNVHVYESYPTYGDNSLDAELVDWELDPMPLS